jgi:transposase
LPWQTAYHYFRAWRMDGSWEQIHTALRERLRRLLGREPTPSAAIIDSQSRPRPRYKEAHEATTVARKSAVESDICSSMRKVW